MPYKIIYKDRKNEFQVVLKSFATEKTARGAIAKINRSDPMITDFRLKKVNKKAL